MAVNWTDDLSTGSEEIDNQHKELFKRINDLMEACRQGKGKAEVGQVIQFLADYVDTHFSDEEKYMERFAYPEFAKHRAQHLEFMENFGELKRQFEEEGPGLQLIVRTNHLVIQWLLNHIRKVDRALGVFQRTKI